MDLTWSEDDTKLVCQRLGADLSRGEIASLSCAALGMSVPAEAKYLALSLDTIKARRKSVVSKLGARSLAEAVAIMQQGGRGSEVDVSAPGPRARLSHLAERVLA